jgi:hypothetical protein
MADSAEVSRFSVSPIDQLMLHESLTSVLTENVNDSDAGTPDGPTIWALAMAVSAPIVMFANIVRPRTATVPDGDASTGAGVTTLDLSHATVVLTTVHKTSATLRIGNPRSNQRILSGCRILSDRRPLGKNDKARRSPAVSDPRIPAASTVAKTPCRPNAR